jgi:hypothetical protein
MATLKRVADKTDDSGDDHDNESEEEKPEFRRSGRRVDLDRRKTLLKGRMKRRVIESDDEYQEGADGTGDEEEQEEAEEENDSVSDGENDESGMEDSHNSNDDRHVVRPGKRKQSTVQGDLSRSVAGFEIL